MSMDIVADSLNSAPSRWRLPEEIPRRLGKPIGFAVPASEQEEQRFFGQIRHRNLLRLRNDHVGGSGIVHERAAGDARATPWRNDAGAPVAKAVTIGRYRDRRVDQQVVTADEIGHACEVDVEVEYHRGWLRAVVDHFEADANLHHGLPGSSTASARARLTRDACGRPTPPVARGRETRPRLDRRACARANTMPSRPRAWAPPRR